MQSTQERILIVCGCFLAAFCGSQLSSHIGFHDLGSWVLPGFALGIVLVAIAPTNGLKRRIRQLEDRIGITPEKEVR
jgi:hypothetical protein